ncbi:MAG: hypothetical protein M0034_06610 [Deltaproteobacteria bacterium]|jgi:hypothetical protein|nr:hypothetical protein [Deltaproteobacteria bacterium]
MKKVTAENLKAGDILAKDIISGKEITVLKKGMVLTDKFIGNIKKITAESTGASDNYIFIEGTSGAESENDTENKEKMEKELSLLEKRFLRAESGKFMEEIKEIIKNVIIKNYGGSLS